MTGKDKILEYCSKIASVEDAMAAEDIVYAVKRNAYEYLYDHCPTSWGLDSFVPLCEDGKSEYMYSVKEMCKKCWEKALNFEIQ